MLGRIATFTVRRRRLVLGLALLAFVASAAIGGGVAERLSSGGFEDPGAESTAANQVLEDEFETGTPNIVLVVTAEGGDVDDPAVAAAADDLAAELAAETSGGKEMAEVLSYWDLPAGNPLASTDGTRALVLGRFPDSGDEMITISDRVIEDYTRAEPDAPISVQVGGLGPVFAQVNKTIEDDLVRAEMIALPITLLLLLFIFRGVVAAVVPLAIGALAVVGTFLVLFIINEFTEVSVFALNLTTAMGLGLAIDYSLFIVSRYREELEHHTTEVAIRRTVLTAGRTVLFSALTVAASLCALLVFDIAFLKSFAYAGLAVSALAGLYAVVVLPAMLAALGPKIDALPVRRRRTAEARAAAEATGFWHRAATFVMRRPIPITVGIVALLLFLGAPTAGMKLGFPDDRVLPPGKSARDTQDVIRQDFSAAEAGAAAVVISNAGPKAERADAVDGYAAALAQVDGVTRVDAETGIYCGSGATLAGSACTPGDLVVPAEASPDLTERFSAEGTEATYLSVVPSVEPLSPAGEAFASDLRAVASPFDDVEIGGQSAQLVDAKSSIYGDVPLALAIIAVITFVLLFLMFGSVVVPIKALALNILSLSATFGAMVFIFQEGHGSGLLGFTPTGTIAATIPVLMFCVAFGLSMDYEVFLLSRIKEEHDKGADNITSVARGLERTGGIVTAAALLISVVFLAFATSEVSFIKLFGIGLTLAVLLDAFIIRGTLVPAFMRLAGDANWWAPGWMKRIHARIGISEHVELDDEPAPTEPALDLTATAPDASIASDDVDEGDKLRV
ncbi:MAG: Integral rane protein [Ilumatobacteraceae bacterium]|nr:Integral rane protein [Ilumatobacteraceae bacterium]